MGLFGRIVGGALQGAGQGMAAAAEARRQAGLEMLRQQFQTQQADTAYHRQLDRDSIQQGYKVTNDERDYQQDVGKVAFAGRVQQQRDASQHGYTMQEIGAKQVNEQENIRLKSRLDRSNTEAEIRLRDNLESGDYRSVVRGNDGTYYGVTDRGLVPTGVKFDPTAAAASSNGGGQLDQNAREAAFNDDSAAWREKERANPGQNGPKPKASDYIGMTYAEYDARRGGDATPDPSGGGGGLLSNPTAQRAPAKRGAPAAAQVPAYGSARRADTAAPDDPDANAALVNDGRGFMNQFPRATAAANRRQDSGGENTYTLADLRDFAKAKGMTIEQARAWAAGQGLKMTGAK